MRVCAELRAAVTAGLTVLTPNAELSAALTDAVEREHRRLGLEVWATPRIRELNSWLRERSAAHQLMHSHSPRCLADVEERELWRAVVEDSALGRDFVDPAAGARAARRARRTVREYGIPWRALQSDTSPETQAFLQWNEDFERRCRELHCVSVDSLLADTVPPAAHIVWIESPAWRPVARNWLLAFGPPLLPEAVPQSAVATYGARLVAATPELELAACADWAAQQLRSMAGFRGWIHVRDLNRRRAEVVDAFDAALMPQRFALREDRTAAPYAVAGGTPLADYAPVRAALKLLEACSGVINFQAFSELLRMPELHASIEEAALTARLELSLRARAPSEAQLSAWLPLAAATAQAMEFGLPSAVTRLGRALELLHSARGSQAFSTWVSLWVAAIEAGPWSQRSRWSSVEFQAAERFRELLAALAAADAVIGAQGRESAQRVLSRAARETAFQPQTGVPAVWISGQAIDPWLNYDGLWVTGNSDDRWPAPVIPVALLPVRVQREYGVTVASADLQMQAALDLQTRWQARGAACVFSWAAAADGIAAAPSSLLPAVALLTQAAPLLRAQPHWQQLLNSAPLLERFSDEIAPPFAHDVERTRGVTTLRDQSRCAFRGFAGTRLHTEQMPLPMPGFNSRERGDLVHFSLEHVWGELRDSTTLASIPADALQQLLADAAQRAVDKVCRRRNPGRLWRQRELVRLQTLLTKWLVVEGQRAPFHVEHIEHSAHTATLAGLEFRTRIDRVDSLADGARVLIDYKTGAATPDWRGERPDNPQLPFYALLQPDALVAVAYGRVNAANLAFVAETERGDLFKKSGRPTQLENQDCFAELIAVWRERLQRIAADFAAGRAEVAPTLKACASCDLQGLCRVPAALDAEEDEDE